MKIDQQQKHSGENIEQDSKLHATLHYPHFDTADNIETITTPFKGFVNTSVFDNWERYQLIEPIGEGGMGIVYKAKDLQLNRFVALKFIKDRGQEQLQRFFHEAQAQARIENRYICKVYEAAQYKDYPYIAMQYIEGQSLSKVCPKLTLAQKLKVIVNVTEGLHAAHRSGLIHRDIKPSNIMVEILEDGSIWPYVMDFGIAREVAAEGKTMTGAIMGTPAYMAPEQAMGEIQKLDRRSDVYSLGATLYQLLLGEPPFGGTAGIGILLKVVREEPQPLRKRDPNIPIDLETIVMKCLEKEQHRRYDSAKALGDELQRYIDGEPILARRASLGYLFWKKAQKHRAIFVVLTIALTTILLMGVFALRTYLRSKEREQLAREQAKLAQEFGQQVKEVEAILRYSHLLPLHNNQIEKNLVKERMKQISVKIDRLGVIGELPGHYALGRGYMALGNYTEARQHLERAWQGGYQQPEVAYAIGQVMGALYQKALEESHKISSKELREAHKTEIQREFKQPALLYLKAGSGYRSESSSFVQGEIAFYEERYHDALAHTQAAFQQLPWLYEAKKLEGDIYLNMGYDKQSQGEHDAATELYKKSAQAYQIAATLGESDETIYESDCLRNTRLLDLERTRGISPADSFQAAVSACDKALIANPDSTRAYTNKSRAYLLWGEYQTNKGEDPTGTYQQAIELGKQVVRLDPRDFEAYYYMGNIYWRVGEQQQNYGQDPTGSYNLSKENFLKAIELNSGYSNAFGSLGNTYRSIAQYQISKNIDPTTSFNQASASFVKALEIDPNRAWTNVNLGVVYYVKGQYAENRGEDPLPFYEQATEYYNRAIKINPKLPSSYNNLGGILKRQGLQFVFQKKDPTEKFSQARAAYQQAIQLNPKNFAYHLGLASIYIEFAAQEIRQNKPGREYLEKAEQGLNQAIELNDQDYVNYLAMAFLYRWQAEAKLINNESPHQTIAQGLAAVDKTLALNPENNDVIALRGAFYFFKARTTSGKERLAAARRAVDLLSPALKKDDALKREFQSMLIQAQSFLQKKGAGGW